MNREHSSRYDSHFRYQHEPRIKAQTFDGVEKRLSEERVEQESFFGSF
jgi:hypothetical protein